MYSLYNLHLKEEEFMCLEILINLTKTLETTKWIPAWVKNKCKK